MLLLPEKKPATYVINETDCQKKPGVLVIPPAEIQVIQVKRCSHFIVQPKQIKTMPFIACCKPLVRKRFSKTLLIMRLTSILLLAFCLNSYAEGFAQKLTLSEKDVPLEKVFNEIKKQTGYTFIYREKLLQKTKNISISITNATLEQALDICLRDQQLTYTILNKMVVIKEVEVLQTKEPNCSSPCARYQWKSK
jgi:hypothetical protein